MEKYLHKYKIKLSVELEDEDYLQVDISTIVGITEMDKSLAK